MAVNESRSDGLENESISSELPDAQGDPACGVPCVPGGAAHCRLMASPCFASPWFPPSPPGNFPLRQEIYSTHRSTINRVKERHMEVPQGAKSAFRRVQRGRMWTRIQADSAHRRAEGGRGVHRLPQRRDRCLRQTSSARPLRGRRRRVSVQEVPSHGGGGPVERTDSWPPRTSAPCGATPPANQHCLAQVAPRSPSCSPPSSWSDASRWSSGCVPIRRSSKNNMRTMSSASTPGSLGAREPCRRRLLLPPLARHNSHIRLRMTTIACSNCDWSATKSRISNESLHVDSK